MKLSEEQIQQEIKALKEWVMQEDSILKIYEFNDFSEALDFVNRVGEIAEQFNHHPDIDIRYNKVTLSLTTHDSGGLTEKDFILARKIDELVN